MDALELIDEFVAPQVDESETRTLVAPFTLTRSEADDDGLTLTGYAAVFNSPTRIADYNGEFTEQIAPGAFKHTIRNGRPVMQFDHGTHPLIGSLPIASIRTLEEDERGLFVEARVFDNWLTEPLRDAIREQAITGMSFRFSVVKDDWQRRGTDQVRTLKEVKLYELGPVVHPAYADTSVALRSLERAAGVTISSPHGSSDEPVIDSSDEPATPDPVDRQSVRTRAQRQALADAVRPQN